MKNTPAHFNITRFIYRIYVRFLLYHYFVKMCSTFWRWVINKEILKGLMGCGWVFYGKSYDSISSKTFIAFFLYTFARGRYIRVHRNGNSKGDMPRENR